MIDREEWSTTRFLTTFRTTIWSVSVYLPMMSKNGSQAGPQRLREKLLLSLHGSHKVNVSMMLLSDQYPNPTITGPVTPPELTLDASSVWLWLESSQLRTSMLDVSLHTSICTTTCSDHLLEVSSRKNHSWCGVNTGDWEPCSTTQTSGGGTLPESSQKIHQFQMLISSGEWDRLQSSINTTRPVTDTEWESQDTCLGMDPWTSQSCLSSSTREQMLSTEPSRWTPIPLHNLLEVSCLFHTALFKICT